LGGAVFVHKKHAKNTVFFESDGEKGLKALKGEKGVPPKEGRRMGAIYGTRRDSCPYPMRMAVTTDGSADGSI
jgi:hypothetical protein